MARKIWLTRHAIQTKFVLIVVLSMAVPSILLSGCLYFLIFSLLAEQLALPEGIFTVLGPVFKKINIIMVIGLPIVFAVIVVGALKISSRLAGPIERLESDLDEILKGNWEQRLSLRTDDDLTGVAERINRVLDRNIVSHPRK